MYFHSCKFWSLCRADLYGIWYWVVIYQDSDQRHFNPPVSKLPTCPAGGWLHKNIERHTADTIVSWPNPKQWVIVHTPDLMVITKQSIYILSIITREMGKLKTYSPTYCLMDNGENMTLTGLCMFLRYHVVTEVILSHAWRWMFYMPT